MSRRFVDLSIFLENEVASDPPGLRPQIQYFTHEHTYEHIAPFFPGLRKEDLPGNEAFPRYTQAGLALRMEIIRRQLLAELAQ